MPQVSYLVREQVRARLATPLTGFNALLGAACENQVPHPEPYVIDFSHGSSNFWQSNITAEELDASSSPSGTLCLIYGVRATNENLEKFTLFAGTVQVGVDFDIAWEQEFVPSNTEGLADATQDAMIQAMNAQAYYASFGNGVLWNGLIDEGTRGSLRRSGPGWRQRIPFVLTFEVHA